MQNLDRSLIKTHTVEKLIEAELEMERQRCRLCDDWQNPLLVELIYQSSFDIFTDLASLPFIFQRLFPRLIEKAAHIKSQRVTISVIHRENVLSLDLFISNISTRNLKPRFKIVFNGRELAEFVRDDNTKSRHL